MSAAYDLFTYPQVAGFKRRNTSREAAERCHAPLLRAKVFAELEKQRYMTADECADALGLSVLSIRPRFSELSNLGKIMDAGFRRLNSSGRSAIVWKVVP